MSRFPDTMFDKIMQALVVGDAIAAGQWLATAPHIIH
jgi:hypothetical protein